MHPSPYLQFPEGIKSKSGKFLLDECQLYSHSLAEKMWLLGTIFNEISSEVIGTWSNSKYFINILCKTEVRLGKELMFKYF